MTEILFVAATLVGTYLIGSIPSGYWLVKFWKGIDLRTTGSGNVGATNVYRVVGFWPAFAVALFDILKGYFPVLFASHFLHSEILTVLVALVAVLGHSKSIFLNFKGGKSVATGVGVVFGVTPMVAFIMMLIWMTILFFSRYVSLASIVAAFITPIMMFLFHEPWPYIAFGFFGGLYVIWRHRSNIERLLNGTEVKTEWKRP